LIDLKAFDHGLNFRNWKYSLSFCTSDFCSSIFS